MVNPNLLVYEQVSQRVLQMLRDGKCRKGDRLPPERELSRLLGINYQTVRQGVLLLADYGIVERFVGKGTFLRIDPWEVEETIAIAPEWRMDKPVIAKAQKTKIAVIAQDTGSPFAFQLIQQVLSDLGKLGFNFSYRPLGPMRSKRLLAEIRDVVKEGCVGALLFGLPDQFEPSRSIEEACRHAPIPLVLNRHYHSLEKYYRYDLPYIGWHEIATTYVGFNYLRGIGVEEFLYVTPRIDTMLTRQRHKDQFEYFLKDAGLPGTAIEYPGNNECLFQSLKRISLSKHRFGVMCYDDATALSFMFAALRHELQAPKDFSLIGANDNYVSTIIEPMLTTTTFDYASVSISMISKLLSECDLPTLRLPVPAPPKLVIRQSCGGKKIFENSPDQLAKLLAALQRTSEIRNIIQRR